MLTRHASLCIQASERGSALRRGLLARAWLSCAARRAVAGADGGSVTAGARANPVLGRAFLRHQTVLICLLNFHPAHAPFCSGRSRASAAQPTTAPPQHCTTVGDLSAAGRQRRCRRHRCAAFCQRGWGMVAARWRGNPLSPVDRQHSPLPQLGCSATTLFDAPATAMRRNAVTLRLLSPTDRGPQATAAAWLRRLASWPPFAPPSPTCPTRSWASCSRTRPPSLPTRRQR